MASSQIPALSSTLGGANGGGSHSSRSSSLVRSKSLRLPSATRRSTEANTPGSPSTLTRHGSMRVSRTQNPIPTSISAATLSSSLKQNAKKPPPPPVKPKPIFGDKLAEKPTSNGNSVFVRPTLKPSLSEEDRSVRTTSPKSDREQSVVKSVGFEGAQVSNGHNGMSHSQPSLPRDLGMSLDPGHWRRLTEEHEKLQMEYARMRMQHMDNAASKLMSSSQFVTRKDANSLHTAYSDTHLDTIPEDGPSSLNKLRGVLSEEKQQYVEEYVQQLESLVTGYRAEVLRVQEESRKTQRKYWDNVIKGQGGDGPGVGTAKQITELLEKMEDKQNEMNQLNSKVQTMSSQLASTHEELQKCHNALQDYQYQIESGDHERAELEKRLRDLRGDLSEARESVEFLQAERTTLAETLQETEQGLRIGRQQWEKDRATFRDVAQKHRKLYAKVQDKNLQLQILQAELEATEGRARDMLLSQGAQLTLGAVSVSQLSSRINIVLASILDYAAVDLGLETEVNNEIIGDGEEFGPDPVLRKGCKGERVRLPSEDSVDSGKSMFNGRVPSSSSEDTSPTTELPPSEPRSRSTSLVQSIIQALEQQTSRGNSKTPSRANSPVKQVVSKVNSAESDGEKRNGAVPDPATILKPKEPPGSNSISSELPARSPEPLPSSGPPGSPSRPVGMATAFRTSKGESNVRCNGSAQDEAALQEEESSSLDNQAKQANAMLNKLVAVLALIQRTVSQHLKERDVQIASLEEDVSSMRSTRSELELDLASQSALLQEEKIRVGAMLQEIISIKDKHSADATNYQDELSKMRTKIRSLEAINAEQARQMKEEVFKMVRTAGPANSVIGDAMAICDKLVLRQEITKLKELLKEKEDLLKQLGGKFTRHKKVWEANLQKAECEVARLDDIIEKVILVLQELPEVVQGCEPLSLLVEQLKTGSAYGDVLMLNGSGTASMEGSLIMTSSTDLV